MEWDLPQSFDSSIVLSDDMFEPILFDESSIDSDLFVQFNNIAANLVTEDDIGENRRVYKNGPLINDLFNTLFDLSNCQSYFIIVLGQKIHPNLINTFGAVLAGNREILSQYQLVNNQLNAVLNQFKQELYDTCRPTDYSKDLIDVCLSCSFEPLLYCRKCRICETSEA